MPKIEDLMKFAYKGDPMAELRAGEERKQVPLRISKSMYDELAVWAVEDFHSVNSQIEYLLKTCLDRRKQAS